MGVDGDASTGDAGDLRDVRLHARQPFHLRLDVAFGLVHAVTCGIAYGPLGAMDGEGAFESVFVVGLGAIATRSWRCPRTGRCVTRGGST